MRTGNGVSQATMNRLAASIYPFRDGEVERAREAAAARFSSVKEALMLHFMCGTCAGEFERQKRPDYMGWDANGSPCSDYPEDT